MRLIQISLIGLGVVAALALSVFLVLRNLPAEIRPATEVAATEERLAPEPEEVARDEQPPAEEPASAEEPAATAEPAAIEEPVTAATEEPAPEQTASTPAPEPAEVPPPSQAAAPLVEPLTVKPVGSQGSAFEPLILPPSGLSGGNIAAVPRPQPDAQPGAPERTASLPAGTRLSLSQAQEEKIRYVLQSHNIVQTEAEFPLRPGINVPPEVHLTPLPIELANVVPNYRNYSYVFAQDRIVIVLTQSREIGLVLPL